MLLSNVVGDFHPKIAQFADFLLQFFGVLMVVDLIEEIVAVVVQLSELGILLVDVFRQCLIFGFQFEQLRRVFDYHLAGAGLELEVDYPFQHPLD